MKFGWPISLLAHGLVAGGAFIGFSQVSEYEVEDKTVTVYLASIEEFTNVRASIKKEVPTPIVEAPMTLQTPMDNASEEGNPSERNVESDTQPQPTPVEDADAEALPNENNTKTTVTDYDRLSDLVNKSRKSQPTANQQQAMVSEQNFLVYSAQAQAIVGEGIALTISEQDAIRQRMIEHWNVSTAALAPEEQAVLIRVQLRQDGSVKETEYYEPMKVARGSEPYKVAAQRALNAVSKGAPYDFLSPESYHEWQDMTWRFDQRLYR